MIYKAPKSQKESGRNHFNDDDLDQRRFCETDSYSVVRNTWPDMGG